MRPEDRIGRVAALLAEARASADQLEQARAIIPGARAKRREAVVQLRALGVSYGTIARELGCTRSTIQAILRPAGREIPPGAR